MSGYNGNYTGALQEALRANYNYANAIDPSTGDTVGGTMPWDQLLAAYAANGGQGGATGYMQDAVNQINAANPAHPITMTDLQNGSSGFGIPANAAFPNWNAFLARNPNSSYATEDQTPNWNDPTWKVREQWAGQNPQLSGLTNLSPEETAATQSLHNSLDQAGVDWKGNGGMSIGGLFKTFLTQGALPAVAGAALAGGGLSSLLGAGTLAGDAFLPGALGADGLGSVGALGSGLAGDAYLPGALSADGAGAVAGDATLPGTLASGVGDANMPGALGGSSSGNSLVTGAGSVPGDAYMPGALNSTMTPAQFAAGGSGTSLGTNGISSLKDLFTKAQGVQGGTTALSNLLNGTGGANDYAKLLGAGIDVAGAFAANNRSNQLWDAGSDSRARFNTSMQPGFDLNNIPGYKSALDTSTSSYLSKLSATDGNPTGTGSAQAETQKYLMGTVGIPALQNYQSQNSSVGFGGTTTAAGTSGIQNLANAAGQGIGALTSAPTDITSTLGNLSSLAAQLKKLGVGGDMFSTVT